MLGEHIDVMTSETMPIDAMVGSDLTPNDDPHQRKHSRVRVNANLVLRPGNASDRQRDTTTGICRDLSATGFAAVLETPPHVGDIYWAEFDQHQLQFGSVFVRCMRCRFLNENSYEAAFAFFTEQAIPQLNQHPTHADDSLL